MPGSQPPYASTADYLMDRRRLRRRLFFWRAAAFLLLLFIVGGAALLAGGRADTGILAPHIARIRIDGVITGSAETLKLLKRVGASRAAAAVVLEINSPGGTTTGAEELYDGIRALAAKKPVVALVGTMAASGGYIAALGADHIVSHGNSLVGSIGVLFEYPNVGKLLDNIGVKVEEVKSAPLKASPNGFEPTTDAARAALAALVTDSFNWFKDLVKERRGMSDDELAKVVDGRVFTGRQGLPLKLVDQIGGERQAIEWLQTSRGIAKNLAVQDWMPADGFGRWSIFSRASDLTKLVGQGLGQGLEQGLGQGVGLDGLARLIDRTAEGVEAHTLDGLVAIWHVGPHS